jgi:Avidin family
MTHEKLLKQLVAKKTRSDTGTSTDFSGHWINELRSSMDLTVTGSAVSGTYTSAVSGDGSVITGPVIGFVAGDVIAFSVLWPSNPGSITSWVGQLVLDSDGDEQLDTLWYLVVNVADAEDPASTWTTIHAGSDQFHR